MRKMGKALILGMVLLVASPLDGLAATYYVRQTVGDDVNDGSRGIHNV